MTKKEENAETKPEQTGKKERKEQNETKKKM